eukprot:363169-Chlamydomonas_euryale.AAC.8
MKVEDSLSHHHIGGVAQHSDEEGQCTEMSPFLLILQSICRAYELRHPKNAMQKDLVCVDMTGDPAHIAAVNEFGVDVHVQPGQCLMNPRRTGSSQSSSCKQKYGRIL